MSDLEHSVDAARRAAERGELGPWVVEFLGSPGSDNADLGARLAERNRWWIGPLELPINELHRLSGPVGDPVLCPVGDEGWRDGVTEMEDLMDDEGWEPPPMIVTYRDDQLVLEDGNHRVESARRTGQAQVWCIVGFQTTEDRDRFDSRADA
ncbi:MAG TPA: hypothetical protein VK866_08375 [Acidimicrobiales bacterium]|nr:hypothetical protein [Acidimicrobiales bacterium]